MMKEYDLVVIGAGPGGEKAALMAAQHKSSVLVVDQAEFPGGNSLLTGTIPSKALRETAYILKLLKNKELQGFEMKITKPLSGKEIFHRHQVVSSERSREILADFSENNVDYICGHASFISQNKILVATKTGKVEYLAKKTVIATGSTPYHPPDVIFDGKFILDSDTILKMETIPKSILIYGAGVIGCEYASIFRNLGIDITLINPMGDILSFIDNEVSQELCKIFSTEGINYVKNHTYQTITAKDGGVEFVSKTGQVFNGDKLLYCNGRKGVTTGLNLDSCAIEVNARSQIDVNDFYQTSCEDIYAVGDVIGFPALASFANEQGRRAALHALKSEIYALDKKLMPLGIYTIPEIGQIGQSEQELIKANEPYACGTCHFHDIARSKLHGASNGFLKIIFDPKSTEILGISIIGEAAAELIHIGQAVINYHGKLGYFLEHAFNFPTYSSAYKVAARRGMDSLK